MNRELQWDFDYKKLYYQSIRDAGRAVMIVKIFDKLDNLFLLHLNKNNEVFILDKMETSLIGSLFFLGCAAICAAV